MTLATFSRFMIKPTILPPAEVALSDWELYKNKKYGFSFWHPKYFWLVTEYANRKKLTNASQFLLAGPQQFIQVWVIKNSSFALRPDGLLAFQSYPNGEEVVIPDITKGHADYYRVAVGPEYSILFYDFVDPSIPLVEKAYYADLQRVVESVDFL